MKLGILREGKSPPDKRVPFTPEQCRFIVEHFPGVEVVVRPSPVRCYPDSAYHALGIPLQEDLTDCDVLMGVKEVLADELIAGKTYLFFSHTIKKQPYNRHLLQEIVRKHIRLVDYEVLTASDGSRIIGFGRFAGLIGTYNGFRALGLRSGLFSLKPAWQCHDMQEMVRQLITVNIPPVRIAFTGGGRVAGGVRELLEFAGIGSLTVEEYLQPAAYKEPVFVQLFPEDYNRHRDGRIFDLHHFYTHPAEYLGNFGRFLPVTDMLVSAAFWDPAAPLLFSLEDTRSPGFRIRIIADITCDINGSVPVTLKASAIEEPFYDFNPIRNTIEEPFSGERNITVMAVDNLPCELPADASYDFGNSLIKKVLPCLAGNDPDGIIERATIARNGTLTERFSYLDDFVRGE